MIVNHQGKPVTLPDGIVTICCHCKRVRDEDGNWHDVELGEQVLSHGICPVCFKEHYPEYT